MLVACTRSLRRRTISRVAAEVAARESPTPRQPLFIGTTRDCERFRCAPSNFAGAYFGILTDAVLWSRPSLCEKERARTSPADTLSSWNDDIALSGMLLGLRLMSRETRWSMLSLQLKGLSLAVAERRTRLPRSATVIQSGTAQERHVFLLGNLGFDSGSCRSVEVPQLF